MTWNFSSINGHQYTKTKLYDFRNDVNDASSKSENNYRDSTRVHIDQPYFSNTLEVSDPNGIIRFPPADINSVPYNSRYSEASTRISESANGIGQGVRGSNNGRSNGRITYRYGGSDDTSASDSVTKYGSENSVGVAERPLQLHGVAVPVYKFRGEDAQLECQYDRGTDPLYSVKWYKDDHEFFR